MMTPAKASVRNALLGVCCGSLLVLVSWPENASAVGSNTASAEMTALLPFDARIYDISYQIFLANRNLRDAYRIALAAVKQQPDDHKWRERLAQVAEWNRDPALALASWKTLADSTGEKTAWDQVRRLAPGLFDYRTVVEILKHDARAGMLDDKGIDQLVTAFENAGMPAQGIDFFRKLDRQRPKAVYLEKVAFLQTRTGADLDAILTYEALTKRHGPQANWAMSAATLRVLHGNLDGAYALMTSARDRIPASETKFWEYYAALAQYTQHPEEARASYRELVKQNPANPELLSRLLALLNGNPEEAVRVAGFGWKQHRDLRFLITALDLNVQLRRFKDAQALVDALSDAERERARADARFLAVSGNLYQGLGRMDKATQAVEAAMRLSPNNTQLRTQWLWLAIEAKDERRLRRALNVLEASAGGEMIDILVAARVTLGDLHGALPLLRKRLDAHMNDHVWLMDYADILQETGYPDLAHPLRMRARALLQKIAPKGPRWAWPLAARLAMTHSSGDPVATIMRELLALDGTSHELDNATADALMLWLMRSEQYDRAKLWFWRRYAHALMKPAWAEFAVALIERDRPRMNEMLADAELRQQIDKYDRVQAAKVLDEPFLAREFAFSDLEGRYPDDPTLQKDLVELLEETASIIGTRIGFGERGGLEGTSLRLFGRWPLTRGLTVEGHFDSNLWDISLPTAFGSLPAQDMTLEALLSWRHLRLGESSMRVGLRDSIETDAYAEVAHEQRIGPLRTRLALGTHLPAEEGTAIRLGGHQDRLQLNLDWSISERSFINAELAGSRYSTLDGEPIGEGRRAQLTVGHKFRLSYPDFTVRVSSGWHAYRREEEISGKAVSLAPDIVDNAGIARRPATASGSFFLPNDFAQYGVYFGFGERYRENYTHNWRPFVDFGVTWNTTSGLGTDLSAGVGGKVFGDDHLSISFDRASGGGGLGESDQILWLNYRYFY